MKSAPAPLGRGRDAPLSLVRSGAGTHYNKRRRASAQGQIKGAWGMPRLSEAMKDVISCEKPRGSAHTIRSADIRMGQPGILKICHLSLGANPGN